MRFAIDIKFECTKVCFVWILYAEVMRVQMFTGRWLKIQHMVITWLRGEEVTSWANVDGATTIALSHENVWCYEDCKKTEIEMSLVCYWQGFQHTKVCLIWISYGKVIRAPRFVARWLHTNTRAWCSGGGQTCLRSDLYFSCKISGYWF